MTFKYRNIAAIAKDAGINPRTLQAAVKTYEQSGTITPALQDAITFLQENENLLLEDLTSGLGWTPGRVLAIGLLHFWDSKDIARCPNCHSAQMYPPEIPVFEQDYEHTCSKCETKFIVQL